MQESCLQYLLSLYLSAYHRYCVQFRLSSLTKGCQQSAGLHTQWMQHLREGHQVCVECQPPALTVGQKHCAGDGEQNPEDRQGHHLLHTQLWHYNVAFNSKSSVLIQQHC